MMRVLEFIVALLIVAAMFVVVGVVLPGSGHIERSLVVGKDLRQVYDLVNNFRRLPDYSLLGQYDRNIKYDFSGKAFGPGAVVTWSSQDPKVGTGTLTIASATPAFDKVDTLAKEAVVVWNLDNDWKGSDKHYTLTMDRQGSRGQLTKITWAYDVAYGFNLISRYASLYIHGDPDSFVQYSLNNLQNVLAAVPNIDYSAVNPYITTPDATPVLLVSTSIDLKGGNDAYEDAVKAAEAKLNAAARSLGVAVTGPRIVYNTNYGDTTWTFDVALPISASTLTVAGQSVTLAAAKVPDLNAAPASSAGGADANAADSTTPGSLDRFGRVVVDSNVRAFLAFGGQALKAVWSGNVAGVRQTREALKAYAATHGYKFDDVANRSYDIKTKDGDNVNTYEEYDVYLPISGAPDQTPEQAAGIKQGPDADAPAAASSAAPAPAASAAQ